MQLAIAPGWKIGFILDDNTCVILDVIGALHANGRIEPILILPNGEMLTASDMAGSRFMVGPGEDPWKIAMAHTDRHTRTAASA